MRTMRVFVVMAFILVLAVVIGALQVSATPGLSPLASRSQLAPGAVAVGMKVGRAHSMSHVANTFKLDVDLEGGANTGAFEFDLGYGTGVVTATGATTGTTLTPGPGSGDSVREGIALGPIWPNTRTIAFGEATCGVKGCTNSATPIPGTLPPPGPGMTGTGTLATVSFNVLSRGVVTMTLSNVQVTDINAVTQTVVVTNAQVGVFPYPVVTDPAQLMYVDTGFPVTIAGVITRADNLAAYVGSGVVEAMKWNPTAQQFIIRTIGVSGSNFTIQPGDAIFLGVNSTAPPRVLVAGQIPPAGIHYTWTRGTSSACQYNRLVLPAGQEALNKAELVAGSIGGVVEIMKWNPVPQQFIIRTVGVSGSNFTVAVGDPLFVCLKEGSASWPP